MLSLFLDADADADGEPGVDHVDAEVGAGNFCTELHSLPGDQLQRHGEMLQEVLPDQSTTEL